jgi:hypothetical protein
MTASQDESFDNVTGNWQDDWVSIPYNVRVFSLRHPSHIS